MECGKVTTDSRNCPEGSMFIALKGETFNGNAFAAQALKQGCRYAVIDESEYAGEGTILVDNCLQALQQLANYHRRQLKTPGYRHYRYEWKDHNQKNSFLRC